MHSSDEYLEFSYWAYPIHCQTKQDKREGRQGLLITEDFNHRRREDAFYQDCCSDHSGLEGK